MPNKPRLCKVALTSLTFFALLLIVSSANAKAGRTINIAGLVVDAKTMAPVSDASITDGDNHELGKTDKNGYYKVALQYAAEGELRFKLVVNKKGYTSITQNEHWGDLPDNYNSVMYFGLSDGREGSFSSLKDKVGDNIDYDNVAAGFAKVKEERLFNHKLWAAEQGNQNVLVKVDDKLYIVDSNGWIAIQSEKDAIIINDKQIVEAGQLNAILKRREVKSMTPVDKKNAKFAIYTR